MPCRGNRYRIGAAPKTFRLQTGEVTPAATSNGWDSASAEWKQTADQWKMVRYLLIGAVALYALQTYRKTGKVF